MGRTYPFAEEPIRYACHEYVIACCPVIVTPFGLKCSQCDFAASDAKVRFCALDPPVS